MHNNLRYDDAAASGRTTRVQKERFARDQYVRVQLNGNRTEIGVVADINEMDGSITVTTRHGYDVTVRPEAVHRAFLVVLDLNGVLGARNRVGFKPRPHVVDFVKFVFNHFAVAVWTSGLERTSAPIIEAVFEGYQDRLLFTLFRDACLPRPTLDNPHGTFKDLQRIFDSYPQSFHSVNTIIIDDSPDKCSHPDIALCPIPFKDTPEQAGDTGLLKVVQVLQDVLDTDSIHPLIRAAEERLALLRSAAPLSAAPAPTTGITTTTTSAGDEPTSSAAEITLWRTRLCCENLRGCCRYGDECRFSHDMDDGKRPCSRKNACRYGHASRWVPTVGDGAVEQPPRERARARHTVEQPPRERARLADKNEQFFLSKEELASIQREGRSHTGMPRLDAQYESTLAAGSAAVPAPRSSGGAVGGTPATTFSTNPRATPPQAVHHNNSMAPRGMSSGHPTRAAPAPRGTGGIDVNRVFATPQPPPPQQGIYGNPQQRQRGPQSGGGEVRLHGNQKDGTALLKQLEMLTKQ